MQQAQHSIFQRLSNALRVRHDDITHEPLPQCWVDLIHYLDEKERMRTELIQRKGSLPQRIRRENGE